MSRSRSGKRAAPDKAATEPGSYRLRWSRRAEADLEASNDYIAADNPEAAARWVEKLLHQAQLAAFIPLGGRVVPEFQRDDLREVFVKSYRIVYRIRGNEVQVITVFEAHRLFPDDINIEENPE